MSETIRIVLEGPPVGKGRPRFVRATGRSYTPEKTANYEAMLGWAAREAMNGKSMILEPVSIYMRAEMPIPASWPKKRKAAALLGQERPGKPDLDNVLKLVDALNDVVWHDDRQVVVAVIEKAYGNRPRLEIEVRRLP